MKRLLVAIIVLAGCAAPAPPPPVATPEPTPTTVAETPIGTVRVTANTLNVRKEASSTADVIGQVKKNDRLALMQIGDEWTRVRLKDGSIGFVSTLHVSREGQRARRGCPADAEFSFAKAPTPSFSDSGAHGIVTVDANVDRSGNVTSTKIISNTTGDEALAMLTEREIKGAKFVAPIRNCVFREFIFTYKRSF